MKPTLVQYDAHDFGVGEVWLERGRVFHTELPRPRRTRPVSGPNGGDLAVRLTDFFAGTADDFADVRLRLPDGFYGRCARALRKVSTERGIDPSRLVLVAYGGAGQLHATVTDAGWAVSGTVGPEIGLCGADRIVVTASTASGETRWFVLDANASGVQVDSETPTDLTRAVGTLRVDNLLVGPDDVLGVVDPVGAQCIAVGLIAAEAAGIARWCVDNVIAYLKVREQFGRPIGSFQALQHRAATLFIDSELAAASAWDAVRAASQSSAQQQVAMAGAAVVAICRLPELVVDAMTMFGAIGYTWEHDLHLYWKRAISLAAAVGPATEWARRLGDPGGPARDFAIELSDIEPEFRARVAAALDEAATLHNDTPGRQNPEYAEFWTGPQRSALAEAGLVAPHFATPWGLDASPAQQLIIDEEFDKRPFLVRPSLGIAQWILPTVLAAGSEEQRRQFADPTLRGEIGWCQLFSEPGAGSDLASLSTRATRVEGGWRINGQKVWTSSAQRADWGALLARTDPAAPKHKGIGYFLVDMRSAGIRIRPLRTASGDEHFNEVFFDDVFVPDSMLVGEPGAGWSHALATMANERLTVRVPTGTRCSGRSGRSARAPMPLAHSLFGIP